MVIEIPNDDADQGSGGCGSGSCGTGQCGNGLEKVYPTAAVRYGYMKFVGEFSYPSPDMKFGCGAQVIIQTRRGIELGEMVSLTCEGCHKCVSREQIQRYIEASGTDYYQFGSGKILRLATDDDRNEWAHIRAEGLRTRAICQELANRHGLPMKLLECEHLFGGERMIFYFMAEGRVDFRSLVKELADELQTRIEMRQVGARDEARLLADYETCGRECCCKNFLKTLKPISMKMAKMQKATLDPAKVSGRCGRLKCCLRYEHTTYEELDRKLPNHGARVVTEQGEGVVVARQILTQLLQVQTPDGGMLTVPVEGLIDDDELARRKAARAEAQAKAQAERAESTPASSRDSNQGDRSDDGNRQRRPRRRRTRSKDQSTDQPDKRASTGENAASSQGSNSGGGDAGNRKRRGRRSSRRRSKRPRQGGEGPANDA